MKYVYHVAIIDPTTNTLKYVTDIKNATRTALWEDGKPAKKFHKMMADDLLFGLICNGHNAVVVKCPAHYELHN